MATHLFHVTVVELEGTDAALELRIITGEQPDFYSGRGFALMLLYDPIQKMGLHDSPLAKAVSRGEVADSQWLQEHVDEYVEDAVITEVRNHPIDVDLEAMAPEERAAFFSSDKAPIARFEMTTTAPEWLRHLRTGLEWDSSAYDPFL